MKFKSIIQRLIWFYFYPIIYVHKVWGMKKNFVYKIKTLFIFSLFCAIWFLFHAVIIFLVSLLNQDFFYQQYYPRLYLVFALVILGIKLLVIYLDKKRFSILMLIIFNILVLALLITRLSYIQVNGEGMEPTIKNRTFVKFKKFDDLKRFDVVIYKAHNGIKVGRIVGLPEDNFIINNAGNIILNNDVLKEEFQSTRVILNEKSLIKYEKKYTIENDKYLILFDNRNITGDSRDLLGIDKVNIVAQVEK